MTTVDHLLHVTVMRHVDISTCRSTIYNYAT